MANENKLNLPDGWELFDKKEYEERGEKHFHNRYVHKESKSGISYFSTKKDGKKLFVAESYGIGTIDPETFKETAHVEPVIRRERENETEAEKALVELMNKIIDIWKYRRD